MTRIGQERLQRATVSLAIIAMYKGVMLCNRSLKHAAISLSSCEAEFSAASACAGGLLCLADLFKELHYNVSVPLGMDSGATEKWRGLSIIEIRCLAKQQWMRERRLSVGHVGTKSFTADPFTQFLKGPRTQSVTVQETWVTFRWRHERLRA